MFGGSPRIISKDGQGGPPSLFAPPLSSASMARNSSRLNWRSILTRQPTFLFCSSPPLCSRRAQGVITTDDDDKRQHHGADRRGITSSRHHRQCGLGAPGDQPALFLGEDGGHGRSCVQRGRNTSKMGASVSSTPRGPAQARRVNGPCADGQMRLAQRIAADPRVGAYTTLRPVALSDIPIVAAAEHLSKENHEGSTPVLGMGCEVERRSRSLPLDAIRCSRDTPIWKLGGLFRCRSCGTRRYKPPVG